MTSSNCYTLERLRLVAYRHMQRYFSYICDGTQMCRRIEEGSWTYGRAPNAIPDIS